MTGKSRFLDLGFPKRLGSIMVVVALSALSLQMIRPGQGKGAPRFKVAPKVWRQATPDPLILATPAGRPFFVVDSERDGAMLKEAPRGIDDAILLDATGLSNEKPSSPSRRDEP